jgi:hypothetical protein
MGHLPMLSLPNSTKTNWPAFSQSKNLSLTAEVIVVSLRLA